VTSKLRQQFERQLSAIRTVLERKSYFSFHGTSLLVAFDGDKLSSQGDMQSHNQSPQLRMKLIDFGNVHRYQQPIIDDGLVKGICTLQRVAAELISASPKCNTIQNTTTC